jgi:DNA-binding transcriptional LysR family regulator
VQTLEGWFGSRLLHRTTRRVSLTEAGENFFAQCTRILEDMDAALEAGKPDAQLRGTLRVSAPVAFGSTRLGQLITEFMLQSPALSLHVTLSDRPVDVIEEGFDLALRVGYGRPEPPGGGLVVQTLAPVRFVLCAAPGYLAASGRPQVPADLSQHTCLTDSRHPGDIWRFTRGNEAVEVRVNGQLKTDNGLLRRAAALSGAGILLCPHFLVAEELDDGRLHQVLPDYAPSEATLDAVCPTHRAPSPKVRGLIAFLGSRLAA